MSATHSTTLTDRLLEMAGSRFDRDLHPLAHTINGVFRQVLEEGNPDLWIPVVIRSDKFGGVENPGMLLTYGDKAVLVQVNMSGNMIVTTRAGALFGGVMQELQDADSAVPTLVFRHEKLDAEIETVVETDYERGIADAVRTRLMSWAEG